MKTARVILEICHVIARGACVGGIVAIATGCYARWSDSPFGVDCYVGSTENIVNRAGQIGFALLWVALAACCPVPFLNDWIWIPEAERRSAAVVGWLSLACLLLGAVALMPVVRG
jgi:hypothetical protein